jgi:hypothetical protein
LDYTVRTFVEMHGDLVPLVAVADSMARHAATGYGRQPFHRPTFDNLFQERAALLLRAATTGELTVLDAAGSRIDGEAIVIEEPEQPGEVPPALQQLRADKPHLEEWRQPRQVPFALLQLYASKPQLQQWGEARGDTFVFADAKPQVVEFDLRDESGRVLEKNYFRGYVGTAGPASPVPSIQAEPDPQRRLARLRELGGTAKWRRGEWRFTGIKKLVEAEEAEGRERSSEKTIRVDLIEAAQAEADAKRAGVESKRAGGPWS